MLGLTRGKTKLRQFLFFFSGHSNHERVLSCGRKSKGNILIARKNEDKDSHCNQRNFGIGLVLGLGWLSEGVTLVGAGIPRGRRQAVSTCLMISQFAAMWNLRRRNRLTKIFKLRLNFPLIHECNHFAPFRGIRESGRPAKRPGFGGGRSAPTKRRMLLDWKSTIRNRGRPRNS